MNISPKNRKLLCLLMKANRELDSFTLFRRSKLSFSDFAATINQLTKEKYIAESEKKLKLTPKGVSVVAVYYRHNGSITKEWREVPSKYRSTQLDVNSPYVPSIRLLDTRTFKNIKTDVE